MMDVEGAFPEERLEVARRKLAEYTARTNQILGLTAFGTALACVGLKLPRGFAIVGLVFILLAWRDGVRGTVPYIAYLRKRNDKAMRPTAVLYRNHIALLGWLFLGAVALGLVHT